MSEPRVSIVISSYNYERYVAQAIQSALDQDYANTEVIIVDDGSTDGSRNIIRQFGNRIKAIFQDNQGQGVAMNVGFQESTGELILFLDSDDALLPKAASKIVAAWKRTFSKIHFPLSITREDGEAVGSLNPTRPLDRGDLKKQILETGYYNTPPTSGNVFSRDFLSAVLPMKGDWRGGSDCYMIYKAPFYGEVGVIDEPLGLYRAHAASYSFLGTGQTATADILRKLLIDDLKRSELLQQTSNSLNLRMSSNAVFRTWPHLKIRLALAKVDPEVSGVSNESLLRIASRAIWSVVRTHGMTFPHKIASIGWCICLVLANRRIATNLIATGFASGSRTRVMNNLLRDHVAI